MTRVRAFTSLELAIAAVLLALIMAIGYSGMLYVRRSFSREHRTRAELVDMLRTRSRLATDLDLGIPEMVDPNKLFIPMKVDTVCYRLVDSALIRTQRVFVDTMLRNVKAIRMDDGERAATVSLSFSWGEEEHTLVVRKRYSAQESLKLHGRQD